MSDSMRESDAATRQRIREMLKELGTSEHADCVARERELETALTEARQQLTEAEARVKSLEADAAKLVCSYCGHVETYESAEARWTDAGRQRQIDHILTCPKRPEVAIIEKLEAAESQLQQMREALTKLKLACELANGAGTHSPHFGAGFVAGSKAAARELDAILALADAPPEKKET
ncbi:MAG: hypothetical protein NUW01_18640 [Gemmatimonadaceae bacterium]|nr:hypothetical protein [Gemmatimonadaceae bacterium]